MTSEKIKISMRLEDKLLRLVDTLVIEDTTRTKKFETLIEIISNRYYVAFGTISNLFTDVEMLYICQALNGSIINLKEDIGRAMIYSEVVEFHELGSFNFLYSEKIDIEELKTKLYSLNDFEEWVLINEVKLFWEKEKSGENHHSAK